MSSCSPSRPLGNGLYSAKVQYGFMEDPDVPEALRRAGELSVPIHPDDVTYFLGRETIVLRTRVLRRVGAAGSARQHFMGSEFAEMVQYNFPMRVTAAIIAGLMVACAGSAERAVTLDLATTTSVQNSGLLEALLPHFRQATVRVHAAGSGRSLEMLADAVVDIVISHAPDTEGRYLADHPGWRYRKLAFNRFVIVGPKNDPAAVREATDAFDAFRRIAAEPVTFVSRGDSSGTHEREQMLWKTAGVMPRADRLLVSGRSMAVALRHAQERQGYTLSDEATFWQLEPQLDLVLLFAGDARLLNTYAVVYPRGNEVADALTEWLTRGPGRERIDRFRAQGRIAFTVWPLGCPDYAPTVPLCPSA
jgi:tungstate transport system substrate-binding protein